MKKYVKPAIGNLSTKGIGIVPLASVAAGLSVGGAFAVGVASGLMKDKGIGDSMKLGSVKKVEQISGY